MMPRALEPILALVFAFGACLALIVVWRWRATKGDERQGDIWSRPSELATDHSAATADGRPTCVICGALATRYWPVSGSSLMDRVPLLNRLYALAPRYVIVKDVEGDLRLCNIHGAVAVKKLEEFHAWLTAERARFNSAQADQVAQMDAAGCLALVLAQHRKVLRDVRSVDGTPVPRLPTGREDPAGTVVTVGSPRVSDIPTDEAISGS